MTVTSSTIVRGADPAPLPDVFAVHALEGHGVTLDAAVYMGQFPNQDGFRLMVWGEPSGLHVKANALHDGALGSYREQLVSRVAEIDAVAASDV